MVQAPEPPVLSRWLWAAVMAALVGVLLFLLHASERMPVLNTLNIWVLSGSLLLVWTLAFGARAYFHGGALSHYQFLEEEAQRAQQSWQSWAQRYLAVCSSCVRLPDEVSVRVLTQGPFELLPRTGQARRIAGLPVGTERTQAALLMLIPSLQSTLQALPAGQALRVTLLSDVHPSEYEVLRNVWQQAWTSTMSQPFPVTLILADGLSYRFIDETLKVASAAIDLILVLQVYGKGLYSDGLAALLLCPDNLAIALDVPITAGLLRPMPLDIDALDRELPLFLDTQVSAVRATGMLADDVDWQPVIAQILAIAGTQGASLKADQQWIQECLCGRAGPLGHWLVIALGVEWVRHQRNPLLVLAREGARHWVGTITTGELT